MLRRISIAVLFITMALTLTVTRQISTIHAHEDLNHFTSCDGILSFDYTNGLNVYEQDSLIVLTEGELNSTAQRLGENTERLLIQSQLMPISIAAAAPTTPSLITQFSHFNLVWENSHSIRVNGQSAVFHPYARFEGDVEIEGFLMTINIGVIENDYVYISLLAEAEAESYDTFSPLVFEIAESLTYTTPNRHAQTVYFQNTCQFSFTYPTGMIVDERFGQVHLYNSQEALLAGARGTIDDPNHIEIEIISPFEISDYFAETGFDPTEADTVTILNNYAEVEGIVLASDPVPETIGEAEALSIDFETTMTEGIIYIIRFNADHHAILLAQSGLGGFSDFEATVYQIAITLLFNPIQ